MTDQLKGLLTAMKHRKEKVMKAMFKEIFHGEMEPFKMIEHISTIEGFCGIISLTLLNLEQPRWETSFVSFLLWVL